MAVLTLGQAGVLSESRLVRGIALSIVTVDNWIARLPFVTVAGGTITYNRESTAAGAAFIAPGGTSNVAQATFTRVSEPLTRIEGVAQIDNFAAVAQSNTNDQLAVMIAAKAKAIARLFQSHAIVGLKDNANTQFNGLRNLVASAQCIDETGSTAGSTLSFALLDRMLLSITSDDARVDFITCHGKMINKVKALYRALGGTPGAEVVEVLVPDRLRPDRLRPINMRAYEGIPIYRNDFVSITETTGAGTSKTSIYCGQWESLTAPSRTGLFGMLPERLDDMFVVYAPFQGETNPQWNVRVEMYTGQGLYSDKALACLKNIDSTL